jgi:hypothetical protein
MMLYWTCRHRRPHSAGGAAKVDLRAIYGRRGPGETLCLAPFPLISRRTVAPAAGCLLARLQQDHRKLIGQAAPCDVHAGLRRELGRPNLPTEPFDGVKL